MGPALAWVGAAPALVFAVEAWGETDLTAHAWPAASFLHTVKLGAWVWNLAGFTALCLVFPDGLLPGRRWRAVAWSAGAIAVAVAVLRHDLFDVDRLLGSSLAWLLTSLVSAAAFASVVYAVGGLVGAGGLGVTGAAFVTALLLLPLHRQVNRLVGRVIDRERYVVNARVQQFVRQVRDGVAEPETVEDVLRDLLADPALRLLIRLPESGPAEYVDLTGGPAVPPDGGSRVPLRSGDTEVGMIVLGTASARRLRRARDVALQARLPIEVSRLRLELRAALDDARVSRARLMLAAAEERRQLERDLHDGAQQQIVAAGMRLRSVQRRLPAATPEHRDLDAVVETLEATIAELRRLAHGVRPQQAGRRSPRGPAGPGRRRARPRTAVGRRRADLRGAGDDGVLRGRRGVRERAQARPGPVGDDRGGHRRRRPAGGGLRRRYRRRRRGGAHLRTRPGGVRGRRGLGDQPARCRYEGGGGDPRCGSSWRALTDREQEVLSLVAQGHTSTGVAAKLTLAERTVETHMRNIFRKLGITDTPDRHRRVLAALAYMTHQPAP